MSEILILYSPGCSSRKVLPSLLKEALKELGLDYALEEITIETPAEAEELRFYGSPTIKVEGQDLEPGADQEKSPGLG